MSNPVKIFLSCLLILSSALACNLPEGQPPVSVPAGDGEPDYVATITAQAGAIAPSDADTATPIPPTSISFTDTPTLTPTITLTPTPTVPIISVSADTNCRTGPGKVYDQISALLIGQSAEVVGKYSAGNYWIIKIPGRSGTCWLWGEYATVSGNIANLPEYPVPPTPTPELPVAPTNFKVNISCSLVANPTIHNNVHINMSWVDAATNEEGYKIYRDGSLLATLGANATSFSDDTTLPGIWLVGSPTPSLTYTIEAFNGAGTSGKREKTVVCP